MALKSVIDVDVADSKFVRFKELFERYDAALKKQPEIWRKIGGIHQEHASHFQAMTKALTAQSALQRVSLKDMEDQEKHLTVSERLWMSMARSTKDVSSHITGATTALLRWTGILGAVGGLLGAGGLWGIDRMAGGAARDRRSAMGLGMNIGQARAFNIDFGRLLDTDAYLGWINQMETDVTKQGPAFALMGRGMSGNTENDAVAMLKSIRGLAQRTPLNQLGPMMSAYGLDLSPEEQRRFKSMSDPEFNKLLAGNAKDSKALNIQEQVARQWQDMVTQLQRAGAEINKTFVQGLVPLEPKLEALSASFVKAVEAFANTDAIKEAIDGLAGGLTWLNSKLGGAEKTAKDIGRAVEHPIDWLRGGLNSPSDVWGKFKGGVNSFFGKFGVETDPLKAFIKGQATRYGVPQPLVNAVIAMESGGDPNAVSKKGAQGLMQLMPDTQKRYGVTDPFNPYQNVNGGIQALADLFRKYHGDAAETLAAYNAGAGRVDAARARSSESWLRYMPNETQAYVARGMTITIQNNTGGSATVAVSQLAH